MAEDEDSPPTEPTGALEPPRRRPPTAVATVTPGPPPERRPRSETQSAGVRPFLFYLSRALDVVDTLADAVAETLHLRPMR
jgi:hypothetical protein